MNIYIYIYVYLPSIWICVIWNHIQRNTGYPKSHISIWGYWISNVNYNNMGCCMPDICHIHGG